jgi:hypothetical protein
VTHAPVEAPEVDAWVRRVGVHLGPARACVEQHPEPGATVVGLRALRTGETAILTQSGTKGVFACVHDGHDVVYQAEVDFPENELAALPFVILEGGAPQLSGVCLAARELYWDSRLIGWVAERVCDRE